MEAKIHKTHQIQIKIKKREIKNSDYCLSTYIYSSKTIRATF